MKNRWKKLLCVTLAGAMTVSLGACAGNDKDAKKDAKEQKTSDTKTDEKTKLTFSLWDENQLPVFEDIIAKFEEQEKNIDVDVQLTPWSQYWTKLDAALGGKNAADVFWMNTNLPKYADAGMIEPLDEYIKKDNIDMNGYVEAVTKLYNYDGKQYGMPKGMDTVQVFYNKGLFSKYGVELPKEGWTWEDMTAIGEQLRDKIKAGGGDEYPLAMELDGQPSFLNFIWQDGANVLSEDGTKSGLKDAGAVKSYQDVVDLLDNGVMAPFQVLSDTKGTDLFLSEKAAILFMGTWKASVIDEASFAGEIGVIPMPKKSVNNESVLAGLSYAMNSNCENKEAAWKLVKFLSGEESNKLQAEAKIDMPALISAQEYYLPNFKNIDASVFFEVAKTAYPFPMHPTMDKWFGSIGEISSQIYGGELTAEEGCQKMYDEVESNLK